MRCWHCSTSFHVTTVGKPVHCPRCDSNLGFQTPENPPPLPRPNRNSPAAQMQSTLPKVGGGGGNAVVTVAEVEADKPLAVLSEHTRGTIARPLVRRGFMFAGAGLIVTGAALVFSFWGQWQNGLLHVGVGLIICGPAALFFGLK